MNLFLRIYPGDYFLLLIANVLIGVTLVLLAALLLIRIVGWANAAWRYTICLVGIVSILLGPALSCIAPNRGIALLTLQPHGEPTPRVNVDHASMPSLERGNDTTISPRLSTSEEYREDTRSLGARPERATTLSDPDILRAIGGLTLMIWLSGGVVLLARWCHGLRQISALRKRVRLLDPGALNDVLPEVRTALSVEQLPSMAASHDLDRPVMVGLIYPLVILPESLLGILDRSKLADILVHECAHMVCRHQLVGVLQRVSTVCFWPHPLVHLLNRELARAREEVCDNYVLRLGAAPRYARTLLELSDLLLRKPSEHVALGLFYSQWRLEDRIAGLLDKRRKTMIRVNRWAITALTVAFVLVGATRFLQGEPADGRNTKLAGALSDSPEKASATVNDSSAHDSELSQSAANLREIMSAIHTFHGIAGHLPPAKSGWGYDRKANEWFRERPYLSWRVGLLPLLGERELFEKFNLGEPWDSEHNRPLIALMPKVYRAPGSIAEVGKTNYLGAVGPDAAFPEKGTITIPEFTDGTSKTIMLVEVSDEAAVEWTRPDDFPADTEEPVKVLVGLRKDGFLTAFADGSPNLVSSDIPPEVLKLLYGRSDRTPVVAEGEQRRWVRFVQPGTKPADKNK